MQLAKLLLADLHDGLTERIARYRYLNDISASLGEGGTIVFGGTAAYASLNEARSSFVHGNFVASILLCQALAENILAGYLHVRMEELPPKVSFNETLKRCQAQGILSQEDADNLKKLAGLRNPLSHFRNIDDPDNLMRRSMTAGTAADDLLSTDAHFAIATAIRLLASSHFRVGA